MADLSGRENAGGLDEGGLPIRMLHDRVLFDPEDRAEVEVRGKDYVLLRERDLHAVAAERLQDGKTGLYL